MTLHSNLLHIYIMVVSSNVSLAEQETQISYILSQSPECMSTAFWYLSPSVISHLPFRGGGPGLLTHSLASDTGEPGWPHLEGGRVLGLLEVLGACPWNRSLPRLHILFQHSLMQQGLKSHHCCSYKITFQLPARGRAKPRMYVSSYPPKHCSGYLLFSSTVPTNQEWYNGIRALLVLLMQWQPLCSSLSMQKWDFRGSQI